MVIFCRKAKRINAELKAICEELTKTNNLLISGSSVNLTLNEKKLILGALEHKPYQDMIRTPATRYIIREVWRSLQEKLKRSIKENPSG